MINLNRIPIIILSIILLLFSGTLNSFAAEVSPPGRLMAVITGRETHTDDPLRDRITFTLSWDSVKNADGYSLYRYIDDGP